ncbi:MAG: DMT family transporter [Lachnospiraceae bacterium]|nr:DMT family transporter [Lachnospiraceae bacterium]
MKKYLPLLANIASQMLFGFAYIFMKMGMAVVGQDTVKFLSFRFGLGFLAMTLILAAGFQKVKYKGRPVHLILICGMFNPLVSQVLETTSTTYAPASQIALYASAMPALMLVFAALINHEYPTKAQVVFVLVTMAGVLVANLSDKSATGLTALGLFFIVSSNIVIALGRVMVRRASKVFTSFEIVYITTAVGAAAFTAISLGGHVMSAPVATYFSGLLCPEFIAAVLYMGIGSCVGAFLLMTYASARLPVAVFASTCTLGTVVGIVSGVVILGETFQATDILGTGIILAGIIGISLSYETAD